MTKSSLLASLRDRARRLRQEVSALLIAARDPRTPWSARIVAACVVAYALSPVDLIPDFIPVLGYLDDLLLVPLGIVLAIKLIPPQVLSEARLKAANESEKPGMLGWIMAAVIILFWVVILILLLRNVWFQWRNNGA